MPDVHALIADAVAAVRGTDVRDAERKLDRLVVGTGAPDGTAVVDAALLDAWLAPSPGSGRAAGSRST